MREGTSKKKSELTPSPSHPTEIAPAEFLHCLFLIIPLPLFFPLFSLSKAKRPLPLCLNYYAQLQQQAQLKISRLSSVHTERRLINKLSIVAIFYYFPVVVFVVVVESVCVFVAT